MHVVLRGIARITASHVTRGFELYDEENVSGGSLFNWRQRLVFAGTSFEINSPFPIERIPRRAFRRRVLASNQLSERFTV